MQRVEIFKRVSFVKYMVFVVSIILLLYKMTGLEI